MEATQTARGRSGNVSAIIVGLLILLAGGGAAAHLSGVLIGVPSMGVVALSILAAAFTRASGLTGLSGFLLPIGAVSIYALAPSEPASPLLLFTGRPLFALALAALVLAVMARGGRPPRGWLLPVFFAIYAAVAFEAQMKVGPEGDEPQYLMVAESLIRDHDLALDQDFKEARYTAFLSRPLEPHFRIRGPQGQIYSLHAVGLSILILPAYWLGGYPVASFFMALLAALLVRELRRLVLALSADADLAEGTAWIVGLSPPIIHFAGLIFTEIPAALLVCVGLRAAVFGGASRSLWVAALCAAALPWLNVRYAILSVAIVEAFATRSWLDARAERVSLPPVRSLLLPAGILIGSAAAIGVYHFELWGFFDPRRVYGRNREFDLSILPEGLPGLFLDQEFGLLVYAPIFALSVSGFVHLWRRQRALAVAGLLAACGVIATASVWPMWRGGFNPPARFLVPLISVLAASLALTLQRGVRPATALLAGWSLWCGLGGVMNIETVHRDRDGVAPFFRTQSGAREWTAALPSFVLSEDRPTRRLAWPFVVLLALPVAASLRRPGSKSRAITPRDTWLAVGALMATAMLADQLSPRVRSPERDRARLIGVPSILLPAFRYQPATEATWSLNLFYEPHRSRDGVTFARALTLPSGRYEIALDVSDTPGVTLPMLVVADHRSHTSTRQAMQVDARGLNTMSGPAPHPSLLTQFTTAATGDFDLSVVGGEPVQISTVRLRRVFD